MKNVEDLYEYLKAMFESGEFTGKESIILLQEEWSYCRGFEKENNSLLLKMRE